jgi:hypothetical protein
MPMSRLEELMPFVLNTVTEAIEPRNIRFGLQLHESSRTTYRTRSRALGVENHLLDLSMCPITHSCEVSMQPITRI